MLLTDRATLSGTHRTSSGYLAADVRVARHGLQTYTGQETGRPHLTAVQVWRPEDEVFAPAAMASAAHKPITNDHPPEAVSAANWKQYAVGWTGDGVARDGDYLRIPMMVSDAAAIAAIESGKRSLSCGYECALQWGDGITPDGQAYHAKQVGIRLNHISIVDTGRAGPAVKIGDSAFSLTDAMGAPRRLVDRDTGRGFTPDAMYIAAMHAEAAKAGLPLNRYVADVLRYELT